MTTYGSHKHLKSQKPSVLTISINRSCRNSWKAADYGQELSHLCLGRPYHRHIQDQEVPLHQDKQHAAASVKIYHLCTGQVYSVGALKLYLTHHLLLPTAIIRSVACPHFKQATQTSYRPLHHDTLSSQVSGKDSDQKELASAAIICPEGSFTQMRDNEKGGQKQISYTTLGPNSLILASLSTKVDGNNTHHHKCIVH